MSEATFSEEAVEYSNVVNPESKVKPLVAGSSDNVQTEDDWNPFDQVVLKCYDVTRDTIGFLSRNGYKSLRQLKSVSLSDLDHLLINPPLQAHQIQQVMNLLSEYIDPGPSSCAYNIAMTVPHMQALRCNLENLKHMIDINKLLVRLKEYEVLSEKDIKEVITSNIADVKVIQLFDYLPKKTDINFHFLLQALKDIRQGHICAMLAKAVSNESIPGV